jgi:hypothetical protein
LLIKTIFIVNREPTCFKRINTTTLRVGYSASPWLNPSCNSNPTKSGVYICNSPDGLVGSHVSLYKNVSSAPLSDCNATTDKKLNICEIRLYSYIPLGYTPDNPTAYTWNSSPIYGCDNGDVFHNLKLSAYFLNASCVSADGSERAAILNPGTFPYYEIQFSAVRYVHSVTLVGYYGGNDYSFSYNWVLTVGN